MGVALALAAVASITVQLHLLYPVIPIAPENDQMRQFHSWRSLGAQVREFIDSNRGSEKYFLVSDKGTTVAEAVFYTRAGLVKLGSRPLPNAIFSLMLKSSRTRTP